MRDDTVSKTRRKQEMHELQALGAELVALSAAHLERMTLPAELARAVHEARSIDSHEARRRQVQYIGKLMRGVDAAPIRAQLAAVHGGSAEERARHQRLEHWRARLIDDDDALTEFAQAHPSGDLQQLRALIRNARREQAAGRPPRAFRELFRVLREAAGE
ncbi:MAG TPA: ribosome biogenesis factor YjgA [Burkholderiales bacterium]|nr:ribosome biogenesis factor YjgA [Burkholderiales bacterium]